MPQLATAKKPGEVSFKLIIIVGKVTKILEDPKGIVVNKMSVE